MAGPCRAWALPGRDPCVVLGRGQHLLPVTAVLPVRRRATGGGAVLAGPWLLRSAVRLPPARPRPDCGPATLARWFGQVHLQWLRELGVAGAGLHPSGTLGHWACFGGRSAGEVLAGGRKLTGIAQAWRRSGIFLAAGTLLYPPPWPLLCAALRRPAAEAAELAAATTSIEACLGRPVDAHACARSLRAALCAALRAAGGQPFSDTPRSKR